MPTPNTSSGLLQAGAGYMPIASGIEPVRRLGFEGVPALGGEGPLGLLGMFAQPHATAWLQQHGMAPFGVGHDLNTYDALMQMRFTQIQAEATRLAAQADMANYMRTFRGLAAVTGTPWGAAQRQAADSLGTSLVSFAPLLTSLAPDVLDQLGGLRGSAAVMARRVVDAGRYRIDPVTGRMGMSAESAGHITGELYRELYDRDNIRDMRGVSAGQLGSLFGELQSRGLMRSAALSGPWSQQTMGLRTYDEMLRSDPAMAASALRNAGLSSTTRPDQISGESLDRLLATPEIGGQLRSLDTQRIRRSLQSYLGVVNAMRDIFGDLGRPNAPMQELMAGLEALTMGQTAQMNPQQLAMIARQTHGLARATGVTTDMALVLQNHAAMRAQGMGLETPFAIQATQGALAYGGAFRALGLGANPVWGAFNADQSQQLDAHLRLQAAASPMANRLGLLMRLRDAGQLTPGSAAHAAAEAQSAGMDSFFDPATGQRRSLNLTDNAFVQLASSGAGGLSPNDVRTMLGQSDANREYAARYNVSATVRRAMGPTELNPFIAGQVHRTLLTRFRDQLTARGVGAAEAHRRADEAAGSVASRVVRRMNDISEDDFSVASSRNQSIAQILDEESAGFAGMLPEAGRQRFLEQTAELMHGEINLAIQNSPYRSFGNYTNVRRLTSRTALNEADRQSLQVSTENQIRDALSPLGAGTFLRRLVDGLQQARPGDPDAVSQVLGQLVGGVRQTDLNAALRPVLGELQGRLQATDALRQRLLASEPDSPQRGELMRQLEMARTELGAQASRLLEVGEQYGLGAGTALGPDAVERAFASRARALHAVWDVSGLRGGYGSNVTDAERAAVVAQYGPGGARPRLSMAEAEAVLRGRMVADIGRLEGNQELSPALRAAVEAEMGRSPGLSHAQARGRILGQLRRGLANLDEDTIRAQAGSFQVDDANDPGVSALILARRRGRAMRATPAELAEIARANPGLTDAEQVDLGNFEALRQRLGISDAEIARLQEEHPGVPRAELIRQAMRNAEGTLLSGTPEERRRRQQQLNERFNQFWRSTDGSGFYAAVDEASQDVDHVMDSLLDPASVGHYGGQATEWHGQLQSSQQMLRSMASRFAGGNMARLMARHLTVDISTEEGVTRYRQVSADVDRLLGGQQSVLGQIREAQGRRGRQWQLGSDAEARRRLGLPGDDLTPEQRRRVIERQAEMGGEDALRRGMGIPADVPLSGWQLARMRAMREGTTASSNFMARTALGLGEFDALTPRTGPVVSLIEAGTGGDRLMAETLLRNTRPDFDRLDPTEQSELITMVAAGTRSRGWAAFLAGGSATEQQITAVENGLASESSARASLGMGPSPLTPEQQANLTTERVRIGDAAEAVRLLGPGATPAQLAELTRHVHIARNLTPEQERQIAQHQGILNRLDRSAARLGVSRDQIVAAGRGQEVDARTGFLDRLPSREAALQVAAARQRVAESRATQQEALQALQGAEPGTPAYQTALARLQAARAAEREAHGSIHGLAQQLGATTTDVLSGTHHGAARLRTLTEQETARRRQHLGAWGEANAAVAALPGRLAALEAQLASPGLGATEAGSIRTQIAQVQRALARAHGMIGNVESAMGADAAAHGVTVAEYMSNQAGGSAFLTPDQRASLQLEAGAYGTSSAQMDQIGTGVGAGSIADLLGAGSVITRLQGHAREQAALRTQTPEQLVRSFYNLFGFNAPAQPNPTMQALAGSARSPQALTQLQDVVASQQTLVTQARRGGLTGNNATAVSRMAADYAEAQRIGGPLALQGFQRRYGFNLGDDGRLTAEGVTQWGQFEQALGFQRHHNLLNVGRGGTGGINEDGLPELFGRLLNLRSGGSGEGGSGPPGRMTISGEVRITEDGRMQFIDAHVDVHGRDDVVPTGV